MGLPIISEAWDGIRWIIDFFVNKAPKPIQFLIFPTMILLVGNVMVGMLHFMGVHCNQDKQPVRTSIFDIVTNVYVFYETVISSVFSEPTLSYQEAHPYTRFAGATCFFAVYNNSGNLEICDNPTTNGSCKFYYNAWATSDEDIEHACVVCNHTNLGWADDPQSFIGNTHLGDVCVGDVYPRSPRAFSLLFCDASCDIPASYKFSFDTGNYVCADLDVCGVNATGQANFAFQDRLDAADARLLYDDSETERRRFIGISCSDDYNPRFAIFGIDLFDFKIWLMITILILLVWGLRLAKQSA